MPPPDLAPGKLLGGAGRAARGRRPHRRARVVAQRPKGELLQWCKVVVTNHKRFLATSPRRPDQLRAGDLPALQGAVRILGLLQQQNGRLVLRICSQGHLAVVDGLEVQALLELPLRRIVRRQGQGGVEPCRLVKVEKCLRGPAQPDLRLAALRVGLGDAGVEAQELIAIGLNLRPILENDCNPRAELPTLDIEGVQLERLHNVLGRTLQILQLGSGLGSAEPKVRPGRVVLDGH
mmetsp:Transcript_27543/g.78904  ORF Transcript_27543/g.78904 Transcript_27543/m.78904 type:complete len:235 (-) Transcript_27543:1245-1949(-)